MVTMAMKGSSQPKILADTDGNRDGSRKSLASVTSSTSSEHVWLSAVDQNLSNEVVKPKRSSFLPTFEEQFLPSAFENKSPGLTVDDGYFIECDETGSVTSENSDSRLEFQPSQSSAFPSRSILKADINEQIPICTKRKSWNNLPIPDLEEVKMTRTMSLQSFCINPDLDEIATAPRARIKKVDSSVSFQSITFREFDQTIGDNPSVGYGTPITLGWQYEDNEPLDIDLYEANRGSRRTIRQMFLNHFQRKNILIHRSGHTEEEIKQAKRDTNKVKNQREVSKVKQIYYLYKIEDFFESSVRKAKRFMTKKKKEGNDGR